MNWYIYIHYTYYGKYINKNIQKYKKIENILNMHVN